MSFTKLIVMIVKLHMLVKVKGVWEHKRNSKKAHKETPFFKHMINTEHIFDFAGSQILDIEPNYYRRITSELVNIHAQNNPINIQQDLDKFHFIYKSLFQTIKHNYRRYITILISAILHRCLRLY